VPAVEIGAEVCGKAEVHCGPRRPGPAG
jgi:hypothetical protein